MCVTPLPFFFALVSHKVAIAGALLTPPTSEDREVTSLIDNQRGDAGDRLSDTATTNRRWVSGEERVLQQPAQAGLCHICPVPGSTLSGNIKPELEESITNLGHIAPELGGSVNDIRSWTCEKWEDFAVGEGESVTALSSNSNACLDLRDSLMRSCCDGLAPMYACTGEILRKILNEEELGVVPPIVHGKFMRVDIFIDIQDMSIADYGIDGGAIEVLASSHMSWVDERLAWNASETGCTSVMVPNENIWIPGLKAVDSSDDISTRAKVMADGRVTSSRLGSTIASCETQDDGAKSCKIEYIEEHVGYNVKYYSTIGGNYTSSGLLDDEYALNKARSGLVPIEEGNLPVTNKMRPLVFRFHFDPVETSCNLCGNGPATLHNGTIQHIPGIWLENYVKKSGSGCLQVNDFLERFAVRDSVCDLGRAYFEEQCCDDVASSFECESSIHDTIVEDLNNISPPDPSPQEDDESFSSKDFVNVKVLLDVLHIFDVDIKSSTMSLLVAVELNWYDKRLSWEPFIGGCHRVSYRASMDVELTEIWVPEIELLNQVEGIQTLPAAHASVRFDGQVSWRRTGVLKASCALTGVNDFPFDNTGCYMEFGGTRDPLYHRIKFVPADPEFSQRIKRASGFQEYEMNFNETKVDMTSEDMSGFSNEVIRYQFYFSRASTYYTNGFVLLYIFFTYLSFGMFFVDYSMGERLGYGSSILFVIVAQDITMSETTPVTNDYLWIYKLSFGSKVFVIAGIVQSLVVLYIFSHHTMQGQGGNKNLGRSEEIRPFIQEPEGHESAPDPQDSGCAPGGADAIDVLDPTKDSTDRPGSPTPSTDSPGSPTPSMREGMTDKDPCWQRWCLKCRRDLLIKETDCRDTVKMKKLKQADWATAVGSTAIYTIFVIVMFLVVFH